VAAAAPASAQPLPRREARTQAILRAALEELAGVGYSALSVEAVAARVGVAKTTIYRRYPTKLDLVRAAIRQFLDEALGEAPDTGSLRGDLIAMGKELTMLATSVLGQGLFRMGILERVEPELEKLGRDVEAEREARNRVVAVRAVARGEMASEADFADVVGVLSGALLFKLIVRKEALNELNITRFVDMLLHGVTPGTARRRPGVAAGSPPNP